MLSISTNRPTTTTTTIVVSKGKSIMASIKKATVDAFPSMSVRVVLDIDGNILERLMVYKNGSTVHAQYHDYVAFKTGVVKIAKCTHTVAEAFLALYGIDIHEGSGWKYVAY